MGWRVFRIAFYLTVGMPMAAQPASGLRGIVVDPAGAVLPGTRIEIRNVATGVNSVAVPSVEGSFALGGLAPGTYDLTINPPWGFLPYEAKGITVGVGEIRDLGRLALMVGQLPSETRVTATPGQLSSILELLIEIPLCVRFPNNPVMVIGPSGVHLKFPETQQHEPAGEQSTPTKKQL